MPREDRERRRERRNRNRDRGGGNDRENNGDRHGHGGDERARDGGTNPDDFIGDGNNNGGHPNDNPNDNTNNANNRARSDTDNEESYTTNDFTDVSTVHDRELAELQLLCDTASESDPASWENIRRWLRNHSAEDARAAAERRGDYETTPLHLACRNCPPLDIVNMLLTASPKTVELADSFRWLPLHYACANEASEEVLVMLAEQFPESKTSVDKRKRTPLHFALGHTERPANVATVVLLSGTGAALMADENGMLVSLFC